MRAREIITLFLATTFSRAKNTIKLTIEKFDQNFDPWLNVNLLLRCIQWFFILKRVLGQLDGKFI